MGWNELQKFIFAKKWPDDVAKLVGDTETGVNPWTGIKQLLRDESEVRVDGVINTRIFNETQGKYRRISSIIRILY